jgi:hypothetical protein
MTDRERSAVPLLNESADPADALIAFGITGDLAKNDAQAPLQAGGARQARLLGGPEPTTFCRRRRDVPGRVMNRQTGHRQENT